MSYIEPAAVHNILTKARNCVTVLLENATYVQGQLADVQMNSALHAQTEQVCAALIGTAHDIGSELFELDELLGPEHAVVIRSRADRMVRWFQEDATRMHQLVLALKSARLHGQASEAAYVLVAESAANVLDAFSRTKAAVDSLRDN
jgi:inactivated superfamily I helicase